MRRQSLPTEDFPNSEVPRLSVQNSRTVVRSPISKRVVSPLNFKSWGISETTTDWKILQSLPIRAPDFITAEDLISVPSPMTTSSSIMTNGPMLTLFPIWALGPTIAD